MKVQDKLVRLVQLTVLLAVPLDAFAMSPGRLNSGALHNTAILRGQATTTLQARAARALPSALGAPEATNTVQTVNGGAGGDKVGYLTFFEATLWLQDDRYICLSRFGSLCSYTYSYCTVLLLYYKVVHYFCCATLTPSAPEHKISQRTASHTVDLMVGDTASSILQRV